MFNSYVKLPEGNLILNTTPCFCWSAVNICKLWKLWKLRLWFHLKNIEKNQAPSAKGEPRPCFSILWGPFLNDPTIAKWQEGSWWANAGVWKKTAKGIPGFTNMIVMTNHLVIRRGYTPNITPLKNKKYSHSHLGWNDIPNRMESHDKLFSDSCKLVKLSQWLENYPK